MTLTGRQEAKLVDALGGPGSLAIPEMRLTSGKGVRDADARRQLRDLNLKDLAQEVSMSTLRRGPEGKGAFDELGLGTSHSHAEIAVGTRARRTKARATGSPLEQQVNGRPDHSST